MADEIDITAERLERELAALVERQARRGPSPTGRCLWCGEPADDGRRWCDADCRDDWERSAGVKPRIR